MRRVSIVFVVAAAALAAAGAGTGMTPAPKLVVRPAVVPPGGSIIMTGSHFRAGLRVTLSIGPANSDVTTRLATTKASAAGAFRVSSPISRKKQPGKYVVLACQRTCRTKATAPLRVSKIQPVR